MKLFELILLSLMFILQQNVLIFLNNLFVKIHLEPLAALCLVSSSIPIEGRSISIEGSSISLEGSSISIEGTL